MIDSDALAQAVMLKNIEGRGRAFVNAANKIGSVARYNRVEGAALGYGITFALPHNNNTVLALKSSYGFEDQHLKGEASLVRYTGAGKKSFLEWSLYSKLGFDENRSEVPEGRNTLASLVAKREITGIITTNRAVLSDSVTVLMKSLHSKYRDSFRKKKGQQLIQNSAFSTIMTHSG